MNMVKKITNNDWPDTVNIADGYYNREAPELTRRNLEFLADQFNALLAVIYEGMIHSENDQCPCGSGHQYINCCGEV
jgi:uncharacterized protein YecA (UPF0149 family)